MKKLILIFIVLSFVSVCLAGSIQDKHKAVIARKNVVTGTSDPCSGGSPGDPGDVLCESFEDSGGDGLKDTNWDITTDSSGANCVISVKQAHSGDGDFDCSTRGDEYIQISGTDEYECGIETSAPNAEDPVYIAVAIKVVSHGLATGEDDYLVKDNSSDWGIRIKNDGGTLKWQLFHRDVGTNNEYTYGPNITLGTWYRHRLKLDSDCGTEGTGDEDCIQWWVATNNGALLEQTIGDDSLLDVSVFTALRIGDVNRTPEGDFVIMVDNLLLDENDTGLDSCD